MALDLNNNRLYSASDDEKILEWNIASDKKTFANLSPIRILEGHSNWISALDLDPITNRLYSGGADKKILEWNVAPEAQNGANLLPTRVIEGHTNSIAALVIDAYANRLYSGADDNSIKFWCRESGRILKDIQCHSTVKSLVISLDSEYLVANFNNTSKIIVIHTFSGTIIQEIGNESLSKGYANIVCDFAAKKVYHASEKCELIT